MIGFHLPDLRHCQTAAQGLKVVSVQGNRTMPVGRRERKPFGSCKCNMSPIIIVLACGSGSRSVYVGRALQDCNPHDWCHVLVGNTDLLLGGLLVCDTMMADLERMIRSSLFCGGILRCRCNTF